MITLVDNPDRSGLKDLPSEISEFLVNALESHVDDCKVMGRDYKVSGKKMRGADLHVRLRLCVEKKNENEKE